MDLDAIPTLTFTLSTGNKFEAILLAGLHYFIRGGRKFIDFFKKALETGRSHSDQKADRNISCITIDVGHIFRQKDGCTFSCHDGATSTSHFQRALENVESFIFAGV